MSEQQNKPEKSVRIICLKVVLKRDLVKNSMDLYEVQEESEVMRFKAETTLQDAFESVTKAYPKSLFIEVYEPKSCSLTSERL